MPFDSHHARALLSALASALLLATGCQGPPSFEEQAPALPVEIVLPVQKLKRESQVERNPGPREVDRYRIDLGVGEYLHLIVKQQDLDVKVAMFDYSNKLLLAVDSPNGGRGEEVLYFLAERAGDYRIEVQASGGTGSYVLRVVAQRRPTAEDRIRVEAALAHGEGDRLRITGNGEELLTSLAYYEKALALWLRLGDRGAEAIALVRTGQVQGLLGDRVEQLRSYERALQALRDKDLAAQQIFAWLELGSVHRESADPVAALVAFEEALKLARKIGERSEEATALNDEAILFQLQGRMQEALSLFRRAFVIYEEVGRPDWAALALRNLAYAHLLAGQLDEARESLDEVLRYQGPDDIRGRTVVLLYQGWIDYLEENPAAALDRYAEARALSRTVGNRATEAGALDRQGTVLQSLGRLDEALVAHRQAREIFLELNQLLAAVHVEANLGWVHLRRDNLDRAARSFERALLGFRQAGDSHGLASTLFLGARIARQEGQLAEARTLIEEVLQIVETHRMASTNEAVRISYLSSRYKYYEFYIDLLMELEVREPQQGHAAAALAAVERSRARSLFEGLTQAGIRRQAPTPLRLERIQREMLDENTLLLVFSLGRERSFVWAITSSSMTSHLLAPAARLEELANRFHRSLSRGPTSASQMQAELAAIALSDELLTSVASELVRDRIVVMADGALHLVPFGALPLPNPAGDPEQTTPLIASHEVVYVPSASVATHFRRKGESAGRGVAVLADPPFSPADPRVMTTKMRASTTAVRSASEAPFPRLVYSRREAEAILAFVPDGMPRLKALGFDARRELVADGGLNSYAILHFATHALLHTEHPERSGLVFSRFDEGGGLVDSTLRVRDIYGLELSADLVVLSACRTALGRSFRGEGVLGLPRAFMYAGVPRVVVSLWDVGDRVTAELMKRFYRGVLVDELSPAAALREAQLSLLAERRWSSPTHWAAFILQGDWR